MLNKLFLFVLSLFVFSSASQAEESSANWYQIEYVLFEHLNSDRHVLRFEDVQYKLPIRDQYYYLTSNPHALSPFQLQEIDQDQSDFTDILKRLSASQELRVHSTGSWQQAIQRGQKLPPLKITGGSNYTNENGNRFELEGELQISRGRYMHVDIDVFLADFMALPYTDLKEWIYTNEQARWPLNWLLVPLAYQHPVLENIGKSLISNNTIHFKQSRRIKDSEIHYIDHPALGLMVTIKEIEAPFEYGADEYEKLD